MHKTIMSVITFLIILGGTIAFSSYWHTQTTQSELDILSELITDWCTENDLTFVLSWDANTPDNHNVSVSLTQSEFDGEDLNCSFTLLNGSDTYYSGRTTVDYSHFHWNLNETNSQFVLQSEWII